jgi:excisionase family DNA binding protein
MSDLTPPQPPARVGATTLRPQTTTAASSSTAQHAVPEKVKRTARVQSKVDLQNLPDLLTISEVSGLLRVSPLTIKRWGKRGKLPAIRINSRGDRRYKKEAVMWLLGVNPTDED